MTFKFYNFIPGRDIPRILLALLLVFFFYLGYQEKLDAAKYSNLILVGVTTVYAYLTYELLRITRINKTSPYIKLELVFASKLDQTFLDKYEENIEHAEDYLNVKQDFDNGTANDRNIVFLKAKNLGSDLAIGTEINITFDKQNALDGLHENLHRPFTLGDLKPEDETLRLFCVFDHASSNDYLKVSKVEVSFRDISRYNSGEGAQKFNATKNMGYRREDEEVSVILKR